MLEKSELYELLRELQNHNTNNEIKLYILEQYKPLINKYSFIEGKRDEDLTSELTIVLLNCINSFINNYN